MADGFNINEALLWAEFSTKQGFQGLRNTQELFDTVIEMFSGTSRKMVVDFVQGRPGEFKTKILTDVGSESEFRELLKVFEKNTYIVPKTTKTW